MLLMALIIAGIYCAHLPHNIAIYVSKLLFPPFQRAEKCDSDKER